MFNLLGDPVDSEHLFRCFIFDKLAKIACIKSFIVDLALLLRVLLMFGLPVSPVCKISY